MRPARTKRSRGSTGSTPTAICSPSRGTRSRSAASTPRSLSGDGLGPDERGRRVTDASFLLLFNAHADAVAFTLPGKPWGSRWRPVLDTTFPSPEAPDGSLDAESRLERPGLSLIVLQRE